MLRAAGKAAHEEKRGIGFAGVTALDRRDAPGVVVAVVVGVGDGGRVERWVVEVDAKSGRESTVGAAPAQPSLGLGLCFASVSSIARRTQSAVLWSGAPSRTVSAEAGARGIRCRAMSPSQSMSHQRRSRLRAAVAAAEAAREVVGAVATTVELAVAAMAVWSDGF